MVGWTGFQVCSLRVQVGSPSENGGLLTIFTIAHSDATLVAAATIFGWLWPKFVTEYIERKSMYSFPSTSHALDPWALMRATCTASGCQTVWDFQMTSGPTYWIGSETSSYIVVIKTHDLLIFLGHNALLFSNRIHIRPMRIFSAFC